ncbi:MAG: hypothetical protein EBR82_27965 [Caulobacteraceae bacterium]|nr:hypothetical protein [Caulobacteraceae bacterium]
MVIFGHRLLMAGFLAQVLMGKYLIGHLAQLREVQILLGMGQKLAYLGNLNFLLLAMAVGCYKIMQVLILSDSKQAVLHLVSPRCNSRQHKL